MISLNSPPLVTVAVVTVPSCCRSNPNYLLLLYTLHVTNQLQCVNDYIIKQSLQTVETFGELLNVESYCLNVAGCSQSAVLFSAHHTGEDLSSDVWRARYPSGALCTCMVHQCTIGIGLCARESLCVLVHTHIHCACFIAMVCRHQPPLVLCGPSSWAPVCSRYHELS